MPEELANVINQEKSIRGIRMGKEEVKLFLPSVKTYYNSSVIKAVGTVAELANRLVKDERKFRI